MKVYTQLNFGGNCEEAFRFYEKNLGGKIQMMMRQDQALGSGAKGEEAAAIIHARMSMGETILIGNDVPAAVFEPMRSAYVYFSVDSAEEAERVYAILAQGGKVSWPLAETFFALRFSQLRDRFGVLWSILCERPMLPQFTTD